jgi:hypothetical protein
VFLPAPPPCPTRRVHRKLVGTGHVRDLPHD